MNMSEARTLAFPTEEARNAVLALGDLMYYANSRNDGRWAWQSSNPTYNGVFGAANETVRAIIREFHGEYIADSAMNNLNLGGNGSFFLDICWAVVSAIEVSNDNDD